MRRASASNIKASFVAHAKPTRGQQLQLGSSDNPQRTPYEPRLRSRAEAMTPSGSNSANRRFHLERRPEEKAWARGGTGSTTAREMDRGLSSQREKVGPDYYTIKNESLIYRHNQRSYPRYAPPLPTANQIRAVPPPDDQTGRRRLPPSQPLRPPSPCSRATQWRYNDPVRAIEHKRTLGMGPGETMISFGSEVLDRMTPRGKFREPIQGLSHTGEKFHHTGIVLKQQRDGWLPPSQTHPSTTNWKKFSAYEFDTC